MDTNLPNSVAAPVEAPPSTRPTPHGSTLEADTRALLDDAQRLVRQGDGLAAFRLLCGPLSALWTEARALGVPDAVRALAKAHPLHALVQQDPFTHRALTKPRGYAGDAVMMDFIYDAAPPAGTTPLGCTVFAGTTHAAMGLSVRYRRQLLRSLIDDTAVAVDGARMLSVASGHCRELQGSLVQSAWFAGEFVALDQDPLSCAEVRRVQAGHRVRVVCEGVRDLLAAPVGALGSFDLIYSAGLYDYLPDALARRLTARLAGMLRPGGRLVLANFLPGGTGRGYMELFMDWTLVLRSAAEFDALARQAVPGAAVTSFVDPHRNVVYAEAAMPA
jgi:SAM-dependent methyltransferase